MNRKRQPIGRDDFFKLIRMVYKNNPSEKHIHTTINIKIFGEIAYEVAYLEDQKKNGNVQTKQVLNIYKQEEDGWKIIFTTSSNQMGAVFR